MDKNLYFYKWFDIISKKLGYREISFRKIFKYLDSLIKYQTVVARDGIEPPTQAFSGLWLR